MARISVRDKVRIRVSIRAKFKAKSRTRFWILVKAIIRVSIRTRV